MAEKDLIMLGQCGNEVYDATVRAKLKGSGSQKRCEAQRLRRIREMSPEKIEEKALQLAVNPETTALEIMKMIVVLKEKGDLKPATEIQLIRALSDAYKTIFGNRNLNVNIDANRTIADIVIERLRNFKERGMENKS